MATTRTTSRTIPVRKEPDLLVSQKQGAEIWEVPTDAPTRYLAHDYFRYIGKFPPQIPRRFILDYSKPGDLVLDPMCGGGTVLIEAQLLGRQAIGYDVNPVAILVSTVATRAVPPTRLAKETGRFLDALTDRLSDQGRLLWAGKTLPSSATRRARVLNMHGHENYFDPATLSALAVFFDLLEDVPSEDARSFILVALLATLRSISSANVKKMNLELDLEKRTKRPLLAAIQDKLSNMVATNAALAEQYTGPPAELRERNAQDLDLPDDSVDFAIIHPPYLTNTAFSEATELQLAVLGISHLDIWKRELRARGSFLHEPDGLKKYILGWNKILQQTHRVLRPGRHCAIVVGDGQMDYTRIPIGAITNELAADMGFLLVHQARHHLNHNTGRTQSRKMRDQHILIFKK